MTVQEIIQDKGADVETIPGDASMATAVTRLSRLGIGALVVSSDGEHVDGLLSERDVVRGLARHGGQLLHMPVRHVMVKGTPTCSPDDSITHVMAEMTRSRNRHLPVVQNGRLCGIVSLGDVVKKRLDDLELQAAVLREHWIASR